MFCPSCKDEFRAGFTRCASCDVDLVEDLNAAPAPTRAAAPPRPQLGGPVPMRELCGFLELGEARAFRDRLAAEGLRSDILIRAAPESPPDGPVVEEYALRVELPGLVKAQALLEADGDGSFDGPAPFSCHKCHAPVTEDDARCPQCGVDLDA